MTGYQTRQNVRYTTARIVERLKQGKGQSQDIESLAHIIEVLLEALALTELR